MNQVVSDLHKEPNWNMVEVGNLNLPSRIGTFTDKTTYQRLSNSLSTKLVMSENTNFQIRILSSLNEVSADTWDSLANPGWSASKPSTPDGCASAKSVYNPCVSHCFLHILEESECATIETGWLGQHLLLEDSNGNVLGAAPCYLKNHSQGEYVFDYGWADAFERAGGRYYPKLQLSVPFTPVTGRRLFLSPDLDTATGIRALAGGIAQLTGKIRASSAHITFLTEQEWKELGKIGFLLRQDCQFHWENAGYANFTDFLDNLASRKRKAIRKERREALRDDITIELISGSEISESHWDAFFCFYMDTGNRKWGHPYLNRQFFSLLGERMGNDVLLIMAKRNGEYIAGALNLIGSETLYGRYWGCIEDHPYLHFEICYYQAIEYAINKGIARVEAGAQGSHKLARGYMPTTTYSAHWIANEGLRDAVGNYLIKERNIVSQETHALREQGPFRQENGDFFKPESESIQ